MPLIRLILHLKCLNRERVPFRIWRNHTVFSKHCITVETGKLISNFCYRLVFIRWIAFNILLCFPINNSICFYADFRLWTDERWAANELLKWNLINNNWLHFAQTNFICWIYCDLLGVVWSACFKIVAIKYGCVENFQQLNGFINTISHRLPVLIGIYIIIHTK